MHDAQKVRFWIAAVVVTALNISLWLGSGPRTAGAETIYVKHASTAQEFEQSGRLIMQFDRPLYDPEQISETLERSPFHIEPPLAGRWIIRNDDEIAFEPTDPPPPGHRYSVVADEEHRFFNAHAIDTRTLPTLTVSPLEVRHMRVVSSSPTTLSDGADGREATIEIRFNQPVNHRDLDKFMRVFVSGEEFQGVTLAPRTQDLHQFQVHGRARAPIGVNISPSLRGEGATVGLRAPLEQALSIPSGLHVSHVEAEQRWYSSDSPEIVIHFDRGLSSGQTPPLITIDPAPGPYTTSIRGNQLIIRADFKQFQTYSIHLEPPLLADDGSLLEKPITRDVRIPRGYPSIDFAASRGRLGTKGAFEVDLKVRNVEEARLRIHRLLEENLPLYLSGALDRWEMDTFCEIITDTTLDLEGVESLHHEPAVLDLDALMTRTPGIYLLSIEDTSRRWSGEEMLLFVGDLGLEVKTDHTGILTWVTDVETGLPVAGANVTAWATNRTKLSQGISDSNGLIRLKALGGACDLVTASLDEQLIFVNPHNATGIDDRALEGANWDGPLSVALYADRGIHRPGETIRLSGVIRDEFGQTPGKLPLEVRLARPDKRVVHSHTFQTSIEQGQFHVDLPTKAMSPTGHWLATVHLPGDDEVLAELECPVMPFLPVRLKVEATANDAQDTINVTSNYLHGAPAGGLPVTLGVRFKPVRYTNSQYPAFRFEDPPTSTIERFSDKTTLGLDGTLSYSLSQPKAHAMWRGTAEATVHEVGGRGTTAAVTVAADTATVHLGAKLSGGELYRPDDLLTVTAIVLDNDRTQTTEEPVRGTLESIDHAWNLVELRDGGREWRSTEIATPVNGVTPIFQLTGDATFVCELPSLPEGTYRFTTRLSHAKDSEENPRVRHTLYVSGHSSRGRIAADRPDRLDVIVEHAIVEPSMESSVLIRGAFDGLALITVETDRIHSTTIAQVSAEGTRVPIKVPAAARDTCFVGATVVRPLDVTRTDWLPIRARGAARLRVDRSPHVLDVSLQASDAARPGEKVRVSLSVPACIRPEESVAKSATVHLWGVEEGALLVTDYHAPLISDTFLRDRRRTVASTNTASMLLPDFERPLTTQRIGGDRASRYREPIPNRQPEIEVLWRTSIELPSDGLLDLDLVMPEINGAMRVMAIVLDGDQYGASEFVIGVVPQLELVAALPRAAAPGDTMRVPLKVRNNTSQPIDLALGVESDLPASLIPMLDADSLHLEPHSEAYVTLDLEALLPGSAPLRVRATPIDGSNIEPTSFERHIAVRPPFGRSRSVFRTAVQPSQTIAFDRDRSLEGLAGYLDVHVSGSPSVNLKPALDDLIRYPYGCGEQIGSRTDGMLAALDLPESLRGIDDETLRDMVAEGIDRLWRTQRSNGMIPYWKGGNGSEWLTLRTALIAQRARDKGLTLPPGFLDGLLAQTKHIARSPSKAYEASAPALACRVLAQEHMPDTALMATLASRLDSLSISSRIHLAAAFVAVGDLEEATAAIASFVLPAWRSPEESGWFTSGISEAAMALSVLLAHSPTDPRAVEYARFLNDSLGYRGWRTTFGSAAALRALIAWNAISPPSGTAEGTLTIGDRLIAFHNNDPVIESFAVSAELTKPEVITNTGSGQVHVVVVSSGIPLTSDEEEPIASTIEISRTWRDSVGNVIPAGSPVQAGDLITVDLSVRSLTGATYENVAIVDALPGGMEFELPSLATSAGKDETKLNEVDNVEFRDDRLLAFTSVQPEARTIRYMLRAVIPGSWSVPAPDAMAMYNPDAHGRGASARVEIALK